MKIYSSYLVCKDHIQDVRTFLAQFFEEESGRYNHENWITFKLPDMNFTISLMKGKDQDITQNMTFEISCNSLEDLQKYAKKFHTNVKNFVATETGKDYRYHFTEVFGPANICKIEINYIEDF